MNQPPGSRLPDALEQPGERALRRSELTDELESRARRLKLLDQMISFNSVGVVLALVTAVLTEGQLQTGGLVVAGVLGLPLLGAYYNWAAICARLVRYAGTGATPVGRARDR